MGANCEWLPAGKRVVLLSEPDAEIKCRHDSGVQIDGVSTDAYVVTERREVEQEIGRDRQSWSHGIVEPDVEWNQERA